MTSNVRYVEENFAVDVKIANIDTHYIQRFINDADVPRSILERVKSILNLTFDYACTVGSYLTTLQDKQNFPRNNKRWKITTR